MPERMHADEEETSVALVNLLLGDQFPEYADIPLVPVASSGTDNALYRLGNDLVVRLPRVPRAAEQVGKEQRWLPVLAPQLPRAIPEPVAMGAPAQSYPFAWSIYRWLDGANASLGQINDPRKAAEDLGHFVQTLRSLDPTDGPGPGDHNFYRGVPLAWRHGRTRQAISELRRDIDAPRVTRAWQTALDAPEWTGSPVWVHGDLHAENLLARGGQLSAVIDFGALCVGDHACDALAGWLYFDTATRPIFREAAGFDDDAWDRGRGWALSVALIMLPYYRRSNPTLVELAARGIGEVLADPV